MSKAIAICAQKSQDFRTPSNGPSIGFARIKIFMSKRHIKKQAKSEASAISAQKSPDFQCTE